MKDIGLGVLDPYTVVIVLVTLVLAQVLFGYKIPLDTSNAAQLFISLAIFTGYIYLARSMFRFPVAVVKSWIINSEHYLFTRFFPKLYPGFSNFLFWAKDSLRSITNIPLITILLIIPIINFSDAAYDEKHPSEHIKRIQENVWLMAALGILDRISVIAIAIFATISKFQPQVQAVGITGVAFMVVLYIFKGNFVALIGDGLEKAVEKKLGQNEALLKNQTGAEELISEQKKETNRLGGSAIKTSKCQICEKICSGDMYDRVPIVCSLECAQKWFVAWDKDWLIGVNHERVLIDSLRQIAYSDVFKVEKVMEQLKEIPSTSAVWALLAIVRDCHGINFQPWHNNIGSILLRSDIPWAKKEYYLRDVLDVSVLDANDTVVSISLFLMAQLDSKQITDNHIGGLLKSNFYFDQVRGINLLGELNKPERLFDLLGEEKKNTDREVCNALAACGEWGIPYLLKVRKSPKLRFCDGAAEALESLGINKSFSVEDKISCPECSFLVDINYPDNIVITGQFYKTNFVKELFRKPDFKIQCPYCYSKLGADTMSVENWKKSNQST